MTTEALEELIAARRREAEEKEFRKKAYFLACGWMRQSGSARFAEPFYACHESLELVVMIFRQEGGLSCSTKIRFDRKTVFEERDFTTTRYIPGEAWEKMLDSLVELYGKEKPYEFEDPRDQPPSIDNEEEIEASLRRIWGL